MMVLPGLVLGYHGCSQALARKVISGALKELSPSKNEYDWLGKGIYFWENDPKRAFQWAQSQKVRNPAVVGAVIHLGRCLDLTQAESLQLLKRSYDSLHDMYVRAGVLDQMPSNAPGGTGDADLVKRNLDCLVINNLHEMREKAKEPPFDTVRNPFSEGIPLYEGGKIMAKTHIQICVRETANILGYFLPR
jgi:hypothetical protein